MDLRKEPSRSNYKEIKFCTYPKKAYTSQGSRLYQVMCLDLSNVMKSTPGFYNLETLSFTLFLIFFAQAKMDDVKCDTSFISTHFQEVIQSNN